jgi:hypothetical protein
VLDGDQRDKTDPERRIFALPGEQPPEAHVFQRVADKLGTEVARLALSMQLPSSAQDRVADVVRNRGLTNRDRHVIFQQIGDDLDFTAEAIVAQAFLAIWAQAYPEEVAELVEQFAEFAPMRDGTSATL